MRVAIDARMIDSGGIGTAIQGWLEGFAAMAPGDRPGFTLLGDPARLGKWAANLQADIVPFTAGVYSLRGQISHPRSHGRWDLLHCPHYPIPLLRDGPLVVSVHDLFHLSYGGFLKARYQAFFLGALKRRDCAVIAPSKHTLQSLTRVGLSQERIHIVPPGVSSSLHPVEDPLAVEVFRRRNGLPGRYLLSIGADKPHKNLTGLLSSYAGMAKSGTFETPLALAGLLEKDRAKTSARLREMRLEGRVHLVPPLDRSEMPLLFRSASGLVFPSLDEGFGYPPLEAMAMGCPVASSNRPPMTDMLGDAALWFDPTDRAAMIAAISRLATDESLRGGLIERGRAVVGQYTCVKSARRLLEVYRVALGVSTRHTPGGPG